MSKRTQKRRIRSLFLVLLLTAALLVSSSYAWFSTNRRVQITDITAKVVAAEGLQISLDATKWYSSVSVTAEKLAEAGQSPDLRLSWPTALEPVSTIGETPSDEISFKYGLLDSTGNNLTGIDDADLTSNKYIAFDVYLKNSSSNPDGDILQLDANSEISIPSGVGVTGTGLENSVRVGFNLFSGTAGFTADVADIKALTGTTKVAIWEPNYNKHIAQIVNQGLRVTNGTQEIITYGLVDAATSDVTGVVNTDTAIQDVCAEQKTLQTANILNDAVNLQDKRGSTATNFILGQNSIMRMRVYIWLEGQDPDCLDIASTGKQFNLAINLRKPDPAGTSTGG